MRTDCHLHVNDPRYPYADAADLHPAPATLDQYRLVQARLGIQRVVVVQPSSYGSDNRCTLEAVARFGSEARAVVVVDADVTASGLEALHRQGARGVRFNLLRPGPLSADDLEPIARRIAPLGWHVQLHASADVIAALAPVLRRLPAPVVFDHLGRLPNHGGEHHPAFATIADLLAANRAWVKLSGVELDGTADAPLYHPAAELAARFTALAPDRVVWGSNWPHPASLRAFGIEDEVNLLRWLLASVPDAALQQRILSTNPARLYGFTATGT